MVLCEREEHSTLLSKSTTVVGPLILMSNFYLNRIVIQSRFENMFYGTCDGSVNQFLICFLFLFLFFFLDFLLVINIK